MKEKEKSKGNPFIEVLHADEELLWWQMAQPLTLRRYLEEYVMAFVRISWMILLVFLILMIITRGLFNPGDMLFIAGGILGLMAVISAPLLILQWAFGEHHAHYAYALTNERVLTLCVGGWLRQAYLEKLEQATYDRKNKITFGFGRRFPGWYEIEEGSQVAQLINETRETKRKGYPPQPAF